MFNLLTDQIIEVRTEAGTTVPMSISEAYADLGNIIAFPWVRSHQRHAFHAFMVQLGAIAMSNARMRRISRNADDWVELLYQLTPEYPLAEPWQLVVDDVSQPAFMQSPVAPPVSIDDDYSKVYSPDGIDILVTARNHDIKQAIAREGASPQDWIYALVTAQTMSGFPGRGYYGISRMNGGSGNRPGVGLAPSDSAGPHILRDINALLEGLPQILKDNPMRPDGHNLLWTLPWDGTPGDALPLKSLGPLYIEVCRRLRLSFDSNGIVAHRASNNPRVDAKEYKGVVGDPWTPINTKRNVSLTLGPPVSAPSPGFTGFTYRRLSEYLFGEDWQPPVMAVMTQAELESRPDMLLIARATIRGQGKTEGCYDRRIPLRAETACAIGDENTRPVVAAISDERIEQVRSVQRILHHAIATFASGGVSDDISPDQRNKASRWSNKLDDVVDGHYFDALQDEVEAHPDQRRATRTAWLERVVGEARRLLEDSIVSLPCPTIRRYQAAAQAKALFESRLRHPNAKLDLYQEQEDVENGNV